MADIDLSKINVQPSPERPEKPTTTKKYGSSKEFSFYKLQTVPDSQNYKIMKFDNDLNLLSAYYMNYMPSKGGGYFDCQCPASRFDCRHKSIMQTIRENRMEDSAKFFCFETKTFKRAEEIGR